MCISLSPAYFDGFWMSPRWLLDDIVGLGFLPERLLEPTEKNNIEQRDAILRDLQRVYVGAKLM